MDGDVGAREALLMKYAGIAKSLANEYYEKYSSSGFFPDDFYSIALMAVNTAIDSYDMSKNSTFFSYCYTIINNSLKRFLKDNHLTIKFRKQILSMDYLYDGGNTLHDIVSYYDETIDRNALLRTFMELMQNEKYSFSLKEKRIISYFLNGLSMKEISVQMEMALDSCYRLFKRTIQKLRNILSIKK